MNHYFDVEVATKYNVNIAIFLNNLAHWTIVNIANRQNYYDFRYWTYNSRRAFLELFPYWTDDQLRTIISNAIKADLVLEGNYNKKAYDKTKWYSLSDKALVLYKINPTPPSSENAHNPYYDSLGKNPQSMPEPSGKNPKPKQSNNTKHCDKNKDENGLQPAPTLIGEKSPIHRGKIPNGLGDNPQAIPNSKPDNKPTTTTQDQILAKKSDSAQVVVLTDSLTSTPTPQNPVTSESVKIFIGVEWDRRLREAYDRNPIVEKNILCVEDYLSACKYYTDNKADNIPLPGRIKGLVKITLEGNFHEPPEWVDAIVKSRNAKIGQERLRLNERNSEARAKQVIQQANVDVKAGRESFLAIKTKMQEETANKPNVINMKQKVYKPTQLPEQKNNVSQQS